MGGRHRGGRRPWRWGEALFAAAAAASSSAAPAAPAARLPAAVARALADLGDSRRELGLLGAAFGGGGAGAAEQPARARRFAADAALATRRAGLGVRSLTELLGGATLRLAGGPGPALEPVWVRVADEAVVVEKVAQRSDLSTAAVSARRWQTFGGRQPARRTPPELWSEGATGPRQPSAKCLALLVPDGEASEVWRGVQPRPEVVEIQQVRRVFISYMGQMFDGKRLYSEVLLKAEHLVDGIARPRLGSTRWRLSSMLMPLDPKAHAEQFDLPAGTAEALDGILFRELRQYRRPGAVVPLDWRLPRVRVFPPGRPLAPLLESGMLNYGHWVSKGLSHLAALWDTLEADRSVALLVYDAGFILDTLKLVLGDAFARRVYFYTPGALYFADTALSVGPEYFNVVDNLARESAAAIRSMVLPAARLPPHSPTAASSRATARRLVLVLNRAEADVRGRTWADFDAAHRAVYDVFGATHTVRPYLCGDYTFREQMLDFSGADVALGVDGACLANTLWMRPGSVIITVVPAKRNYIPIMPVKDCGFTYAWKFADVANVTALALMLPDADANDAVAVAPAALETVLRDARSRLDGAGSRAPSSAAPAAILPGPRPTEGNVFAVYPIDMIYGAIDKGQFGVNPATTDEREEHGKRMALYRRHVQALSDPSLRSRLLTGLRTRCSVAPGCSEDKMSYYAKMVDAEQKAEAPTRDRAVELFALRQGLLQHRPGNAFYLFGAAEQLEMLGSVDGNTTILQQAALAFEAALRADADVGVFDDITRYKAWEMVIVLHHRVGDDAGAQRWLKVAQASGYAWRSAKQLSYPRMFHPHFAAKPFWECGDADHFRHLCDRLEEGFPRIRLELSRALELGGGPMISYTDSTNLISRGNWTQIKLAGDDPTTKALVWREDLCGLGGPFEETCATLRGSRHPSAITGAAKFYLLAPGSELKLHCGQGNLRLFLQLGVLVPPGAELEVGGLRRSWQEGKVLILDDSFVHSVVHRGSSTRVTLSIPVWHPDIYHRFSHR